MAVKKGCVIMVRNEVRIIIRRIGELKIIVCHDHGVRRNKNKDCQGDEGVFSRGSQEGVMARSQSRLDVCCSLWMCRAYSTRLLLLLSWLLPSPPGVGLPRSGLRFHSWCHASSLHSYVCSAASQGFYLFFQCKHIHNLCMLLHR